MIILVNMKFNYQVSLLSYSESNFIKGLLIVLVVIGHNSYMMNLFDKSNIIKDYLYSFHVDSFFYLSCMYNIKPLCRGVIIKNFNRLLRPYIFLFLLFLLINYLCFDFLPPFCKIAIGFISGSASALSEIHMFQFIWFLPSMFAFLILRNLFFYDVKFGFLIIFFSSLILLYLLFGFHRYFFIDNYLLFGLYGAMSNFTVSILLRYLIEKYYLCVYFKYVVIFLFILFTVLYFVFLPKLYWYYLNVYLIIPIFAFSAIFSISKSNVVCSKFGLLLINLGKISFSIYLLHQIIFNILVHILNLFPCVNLLISALFTLFLTFFLTLALIVFLKKYFSYIFSYMS